MPSPRPYNFILILAGGCCLLATSLWARDPKPSIEIVALHAQRYQNHMQRRVRREVFGEIQNLSDRPLKGLVIQVEFLNEKGKVIATEDVTLEGPGLTASCSCNHQERTFEGHDRFQLGRV